MHMIMNEKGDRIWRDHSSRIHNDTGPAIIYSRGKYVWYNEGRIHRHDGPAIIHRNNSLVWYDYGRRMHEHNWAYLKGYSKQDMDKIKSRIDEEIVQLRLMYGK